jgi:hypothetical protein
VAAFPAGQSSIKKSTRKLHCSLRAVCHRLTANRHLKPGYGWIEQVEIDLTPRCDDGTLNPSSHLVSWYEYLKDATARANRPIAYQPNTGQMLQQQGFIDIQEKIIRAPLNGWSSDPHQKQIGRWYNLGLTDGLEALSLAPFTRVNRWDANAHVRPLIKEVKKEISNSKVHAYNNMYVSRPVAGWPLLCVG